MPDEHEQSATSQNDLLRSSESGAGASFPPEGREKDERVSELEECRKEKDEYLLGWQRCKADAINERQQEEMRRREILQFATTEVIQALVPILDTFHHALIGKDTNDPYVQGFGHIQNQLAAILKGYGLTVIEDRGALLDTSRHESVGTVPVTKEEEDNTVVEVVENGYALHEKVIKPAKVKVGEYKDHGS